MKANFGIGKRTVNVTAQLAPGTVDAPGTTTAGSTFQVQSDDGSLGTCTTVSADSVSTASSCSIPLFLIDDSATLTVSEVSAPAPLTADPNAQLVSGCSDSTRALDCSNVSLVFTLTAPTPPAPPTAVADAISTKQGAPVRIDVLANDNAHDQPVTVLSISTPPTHGTAVVDASVAGHPVIVYTPAAGYDGIDTIGYTIQTADGTATANAVVTVLPATAPKPTSPPTSKPSSRPTSKPTSKPTEKPTTKPTSAPTSTSKPSTRSSIVPAAAVAPPTSEPTASSLGPSSLASTGTSSSTGLFAALGLLLSGAGVQSLRSSFRAARKGRVPRRRGRHVR